MGVFAMYDLIIRIRPKYFKQALDIFNNMHSDEMLLNHAANKLSAQGAENLPIRQRKWYSWVKNPENPYTTLEEAFTNWEIVDHDVEMYIDENNGDFVISGSYENKIGQQEDLIKHLAPVIRDTEVSAWCDDGYTLEWMVENHVFKSEVYGPFPDKQKPPKKLQKEIQEEIHMNYIEKQARPEGNIYKEAKESFHDHLTARKSI